MSPDFDQCLRAMAGVVVRVGLNLKPGQPLLITDPYEVQGIPPEALPLAQAVAAACPGSAVEIIPADPARLRALADSYDTPALETLISGHVARLKRHLAKGGAFLFLTGSHPRLFEGLRAPQVARFDQIKWRFLGSVIQRLIRGATQWTLAPAPTTHWADAIYPELPAAARLPALWRAVFASFRLEAEDPIAAWHAHLDALAQQRDALNAARHHRVRYVGTGTDLTVELPRHHVWCTAQLTSKRGVPFVVNLPTEEIFTAPRKNSANGRLRVGRPVAYAGTIIDGIVLEFADGRVVDAHAAAGQDLLRQLLDTDEGARRLGEVAIVPQRNTLSFAGRLFHHTLLDENAANHVALGDAYRFCSRAWLPLSLNSSQIHVDLPLDAQVELQ